MPDADDLEWLRVGQIDDEPGLDRPDAVTWIEVEVFAGVAAERSVGDRHEQIFNLVNDAERRVDVVVSDLGEDVEEILFRTRRNGYLLPHPV